MLWKINAHYVLATMRSFNFAFIGSRLSVLFWLLRPLYYIEANMKLHSVSLNKNFLQIILHFQTRLLVKPQQDRL